MIRTISWTIIAAVIWSRSPAGLGLRQTSHISTASSASVAMCQPNLPSANNRIWYSPIRLRRTNIGIRATRKLTGTSCSTTTPRTAESPQKNSAMAGAANTSPRKNASCSSRIAGVRRSRTRSK